MFIIKHFKKLLLSSTMLIMSLVTVAQTSPAATAGANQSVWSNPLALAMLAIILVLLLVIVLLANVLLGTAEWYFKKQSSAVKTIIVLFTLLLPAATNAQDAVVTAAPANIGGLSATTFFLLLAVIFIELLVIMVMAFFVRSFLAKEKIKAAVVTAGEMKQEASWQKVWDKLNSFRPITEESKIDLGHNYDGIRELNNRLPGWWLYGFYATILFSGIYLWRYHVSHSSPLSGEELKIELVKGEEQKAAYLAKAANLVDENTIAYKKEDAAIVAGGAIFKQTCVACHGPEGQGNTVGPNLTDEYWIHGGSIKDIFKTIKYGYPEKGMQSWKDQYTPVQMAQLATFVKSLEGTKPANPKAPQGDLYKENASPAGDSTKKADSTATLKLN
jgi:cytochrome c oxidase cbb3-type subunit III